MITNTYFPFSTMIRVETKMIHDYKCQLYPNVGFQTLADMKDLTGKILKSTYISTKLHTISMGSMGSRKPINFGL